MADASPFHAHREGALIDVLVQPRATKSEITGIHDGALRIRIAAPAVEGAANDAVIGLLSKRLNLRKSDIVIVAGATGRRKRVRVQGIGVEDLRDALGRV